jgi:hypothetical protein
LRPGILAGHLQHALIAFAYGQGLASCRLVLAEGFIRVGEPVASRFVAGSARFAHAGRLVLIGLARVAALDIDAIA